MKRSEMIKLMSDAWRHNIKYSNKDMVGVKNNMQYVLLIMEKAGMLPPIEPGRTEYDLDLGLPEWEPEDG